MWIPGLLASLAIVSGAISAFGGDGGAEPRARSMQIREPAFTDARIVAAKSLPPQFELVAEREMPTPGYRFIVDAVEIDAEAGRIRALVTEKRPEGMAAQVITRTACKVPLGSVEPGTYLLELRLRRAETDPHRLAGAWILDAR